MKRRHKSHILSAILLFSYIFPFHVFPVHSQWSVPMKVARAVWGENPDSPTKAYPGDTGVALTVEVQNLSPDLTIKGISAVLFLEESPFTDVYGNNNATATGEPTVGELLNPTDEIQPKGFFTLTFTLDIDPEAVPKSYSNRITVDYSLEATRFGMTQFIEGAPQTLEIEVIVSKIESTITVTVSPETLRKGEAIRVSGSIDPIGANAQVKLTYTSPEGFNLNSTVKTNADGSFSMSYRPDIDGFWSVNASWSGDQKYEGDWASTSFEVRLPVSTKIATSESRLTGGLDNSFNITLLNDSQVPISAIDVTLEIPSPLVVHGTNQWTFDYLGPRSSTSITVGIFAPESSIGTTYTGSLNLEYRDNYGESRSDSYPVGLIISGRVELVAYDQTVRPRPARNGTKVEITTTLLNKGNAPAMYVNASILPSVILDLAVESATYVGEVEENSQAPFTLAATVKADAKDGTYPLTIAVTYRDDRYVNHSFNTTFYLTVETSKESQTGSEGTDGILGQLLEAGPVLLILLVASAVILLLYRRHLGRQKRDQRMLGQTGDEHSSAI